MPIGNSGVANQVQTSAGVATRVVAKTHNAYGDDDVGGSGVVDLYQLSPISTGALLCENSDFLVQEDDGKLLLE